MPTIKESAIGYIPKQIKSVADLPSVPIGSEILENNEAEFPYKYIEKDGEEYKIPDSVLRDLKTMLEENQDMKDFKVKKTGEGLKTRYTVIPIN